MNRLSITKRAQILQNLCEGMSLRATARVCGVAYNTVLKLQVEAGLAAEAFHQDRVRDVRSQWVQCDELWAFCHTKRKNLTEPVPEGYGDVYTWVAIDPVTKLVISWWVGNRSYVDGLEFMADVASRLDLAAGKVTISTDALHAYFDAVAAAFGARAEHEVSKPRTTHVERVNLNIRMGNRRFTRRTNAHSKKVRNHSLSIALYFTYYNWCRPHMSLGPVTTPAMAAALAEWPMTLVELAALEVPVNS